MRIVFEKDKKKLEQLAARQLSEFLAASHGPTLLLLAGGSSLGFLEYVDPAVISSRTTIGMFDERFSADSGVNNFSLFLKTEFAGRAGKTDAGFLDSRVLPGESLTNFGPRIEKYLKSWLENNPEGKVLATFGIGSDGHTGGMMPYPENPKHFEELFEGDRLYASYNAIGKNEYPLRGSTTMTFIRKHIKERIIFAAGENKRGALERILAEKGGLAETPAGIHRESADAILFTDIKI